MQSHKRSQWTLYLQLMVTLLLMLVGRVFVGKVFACSVFFGGLVTIVPGFVFTYYAFAHHGAHAAQRIVYDFYKGTLLKFISMAILFALVLSFIRLNSAGFMLGFVITQLLSIVIPWLLTWRRAEVG